MQKWPRFQAQILITMVCKKRKQEDGFVGNRHRITRHLILPQIKLFRVTVFAHGFSHITFARKHNATALTPYRTTRQCHIAAAQMRNSPPWGPRTTCWSTFEKEHLVLWQLLHTLSQAGTCRACEIRINRIHVCQALRRPPRRNVRIAHGT